MDLFNLFHSIHNSSWSIQIPHFQNSFHQPKSYMRIHVIGANNYLQKRGYGIHWEYSIWSDYRCLHWGFPFVIHEFIDSSVEIADERGNSEEVGKTTLKRREWREKGRGRGYLNGSNACEMIRPYNDNSQPEEEWEDFDSIVGGAFVRLQWMSS